MIFLICIQVIKPKKSAKIKYPEVSSHKRPPNIEPLLYCESCRALIFMSLHELKGSKSEFDIVNTIERLCHVDNYSPKLKYSKEQMASTCLEMIAAWEV